MGFRYRLHAVTLVGSLAVLACGGGGSGSSDPTTTSGENTEAFPGGLAIASPTDYGDDGAQFARPGTGPSGTAYAASLEAIEAILGGSTLSDCHFDPALFLAREEDASCYGPTVYYDNHPQDDGMGPDAPGGGGALPEGVDGELPPGDLGIWVATEGDSGEACAAAELNSKIDSLGDQILAGLTGFASMICAINVNGVDFPEAGRAVDLVDEMNTLGMDATFEQADLAVESDGSYTYDLAFTFTSDRGDHPVLAHMVHNESSDDDANTYHGQLSTLVGMTDNRGNCPGDLTSNGSLVYSRSAEASMAVQARAAQFCGADVNGLDDAGIVDPALKLGAYTNGWGNSFNIFTANFDPTTLGGDYSFGWQAGPQDNATRTFNLHSEVASDTTITAFFGFAPDIETFDGNVGGFICNWAGPEGFEDHALIPKVQRQIATLDSEGGVFVLDASNIAYAPTTSCDYDSGSPGTLGDFLFDQDGDGSIADETHVSVSNELVAVSDADGNGVFDEVEASGFSAPQAPTP